MPAVSNETGHAPSAEIPKISLISDPLNEKPKISNQSLSLPSAASADLTLFRQNRKTQTANKECIFSECSSINTQKKPSKEILKKDAKSTFEDTKTLHFQAEPHAPFEQEPIYVLDHFQKQDQTVEKLFAPPPNFKTALAQLPQPLQAAFKEILNGELVGIWPIGSDCLRR